MDDLTGLNFIRHFSLVGGFNVAPAQQVYMVCTSRSMQFQDVVGLINQFAGVNQVQNDTAILVRFTNFLLVAVCYWLQVTTQKGSVNFTLRYFMEKVS